MQNNLLAPIFSQKIPFVYNYFNSLLELAIENKRKFPQAIILESSDTIMSYLFALELARILNCKQLKTPDCSCTNCSWIKSYSHPAVLNVSQIHSKPDGDETKTVISTKQIQQIEKTLMLASDYHRFFIFFSSTNNYDYNDNELDMFIKLGYGDKIDYSIQPINFQIFGETSANALLKSIEEPPNKTTFVFLTKSKDDIISTIVSRCLVFKLGSQKAKKSYFDVGNLFNNYPAFDYYMAIETADKLIEFIKSNQYTSIEVLNGLMEYLLEILKNNINNYNLCEKIKKDISYINLAIKQINANMSEKIVIEGLLLKITRGY